MFKDAVDLKAAVGKEFSVGSHLPSHHTHSGVSTFATCEQKWWLRYVLGLAEKRIAKHFVVGNMVHLGLEKLLKAAKGINIDPLDPNVNDRDARIEACLEGIDDLLTKEADRIQSTSDMLSSADCEMVEYARCQSVAMVKAWAQVKLRALADWEVVDAEHKILGIDVITQTASEREKLFWRQAAGMIDGVVRHPKTGKLYILEHKTRSRMDTFNISGLVLDQQANWYMRMYEQKTGLRIDGFLYNVIKKPLHRMSAKGSDDLVKRMMTAILEDTEGYFALEDVIADRSVINENLRNMVLWTDRMNAAKPSTITRNTSQCSERGGCPYKMLCQNGAVAYDLGSIANQADLCQYAFKPVNSELQDTEED